MTMTPLKISCPGCQHRLTVLAEPPCKMHCPRCRTRFRVCADGSVELRGVVQRQSDVSRLQQQPDLGASKDDRAHVLAGQAPDQVDVVGTRYVGEDAAAEFLEAGAAALGIGGELVQADALRSNKPEIIVENARKFLAIVKQTRERLASSVGAAAQ